MNIFNFETLILSSDVQYLTEYYINYAFHGNTLFLITENHIIPNLKISVLKQKTSAFLSDFLTFKNDNQTFKISTVSSAATAAKAAESGADVIISENTEYIKKLCDSVSIPVIAYINKNTDIFELAGMGISGICVSSSFFLESDINLSRNLLFRLAKQAVMRGAIFDLDGTLIDSMPYWENAAEVFLQTLGITPKPNLNKTVSSMSLKESSEYIRKEYSLCMSCAEIINGINKTIEGYYYNDIPLKPGAYEMLKSFSGIKKYVCTLTSYHLAEAVLKRNGILKYFDGIISAADLGIDKNSDKIYKLTLEKLNTPKKYTYIFEDSAHSAKAAKSGGFTVIGVSDAGTSHKEIEKICDFYTVDYDNWKKSSFQNKHCL